MGPFLLQVPDIKGLIDEALAAQKRTRQKQLVQIVVYNLPDRDCSAKASDGEFHLSDDGLNKYKGFIDGYYHFFMALRRSLTLLSH